MSTLVIAVCSGRSGIWHIQTNGLNTLHPIKGEDKPLASQPGFLVEALEEALERTCLTDTASVQWVVDVGGAALFAKAIEKEKLAEKLGQHHWQVLAWSCLNDRFALSAPDPWACETTWHSEVLPWLACAQARKLDQQITEALHREYQDRRTELDAELDRLRVENQTLARKNAALQRVDVEVLLAYLPALYEKVFGVLGATDLALLCGKIEPPSLLNPYPEPSPETLYVKQQDFRALPRARQHEIVAFIHRLPQRQRLSVRPEMRLLVQEVEAELPRKEELHGQG
ncbi:hypothetical protein LRB11_13220 [Ectothiorhodospira haloalkaliphila]|uniref:hypothetical protein n=1 Tax=Ectothiorhodospira haloalkaliphila TaxID=421628 RepID=UPI001EE81F60|nr:hypothetical protein [Ectothiorhodospira haloalkaliphila]MCG5525882.1 hypothetical protein [Ectothiorhodospira haloalkaliphila]